MSPFVGGSCGRGRRLRLELLEQRFLLSAGELGVVDLLELTDQRSFSGEIWYELEAARDGILTVEADMQRTVAAEVKLHNEWVPHVHLYQRDVAGGLEELATGEQRADYEGAIGGRRYIIRIADMFGETWVRFANLVDVDRDVGEVRVFGTDGEDHVQFTGGAKSVSNFDSANVVIVNDVRYAFNADQIRSVFISGVEQTILNGSDGDDTFISRPGGLPPGEGPSLSGDWGLVTVSGYASVTALGLGGRDVASFYDSAGNDVFTATGESCTMEYKAGEIVEVEGFQTVHAYAKAGGRDVANLYDSAGDDVFTGTAGLCRIEYAGGGIVEVESFRSVHTYAKAGGRDVASFYDSAGHDTFVGKPTFSKLIFGDGSLVRAKFFDAVHAYSRAGGDDLAYLNDSAGDDRFVGKPDFGKMIFADGSLVRAKFFDQVYAKASQGGNDVAHLYGSQHRDRFVATPVEASLTGYGFGNRARLFESVVGHAGGGGDDEAVLYDSLGDDTFVGKPDVSELSGQGFSLRARCFNYVGVRSDGDGYDVAQLYDSPGFEVFHGRPSYANLLGNAFEINVSHFDAVDVICVVHASDDAFLWGSDGNDQCIATPEYVELAGDDYFLRTSFPVVEVYAWAGDDSAYVYDSPAVDYLTVWRRDIELATGSLHNHVGYDLWDFEYVEAHSSNPGDEAYIQSTPMYELVLEGYWHIW